MNLKVLVKGAFFSALPGAALAVQSARARAHSHDLVRQWGLKDIDRKLVAHFGTSVLRGPFLGLTLTPECMKEHVGPFLLGCYEACLHPWLESVLSTKHRCILDVGAKFGYYAVGLGKRLPAVPVVAFDTDWWARRVCRDLARVNGARNVVVESRCSPRWLERNLPPKAFVFSDCEGYEGSLFGDSRAKALDSATLLVEVHDELVPGVRDRLIQRFERSHRVDEVTAVSDGAIGVDLSFLTPEEEAKAVREIRGRQSWLFFEPRWDTLR